MPRHITKQQYIYGICVLHNDVVIRHENPMTEVIILALRRDLSLPTFLELV